MNNIAIVTANTGNFDKNWEHVKQSIDYDFFKFTDDNFPPRYQSMTPRLQARIPKMFAWQMEPGYEYYLWIDSSLTMLHSDSVKWFVDECNGYDAVFMKHPHRNTVQEEYDFVSSKLKEGNKYLSKRYPNEFLMEQMEEIQSDINYKDDLLIASGAFIYRNNKVMQETLKEWWYHTSRYTTLEQLSLPYVLKKNKVNFKLIDLDIYNHPYLTYTRNKKQL